jgi:hypothetical protein
MRPWASWTAKTAALTLVTGLAATAGGLSGVALAAPGGSAVLAASGGGAGISQAGVPDDVCNNAGALLDLAGAACRSVAPPGVPAAGTAQTSRSATGSGNVSPSQGAGQGIGATVGQVVQRAVAPVTAMLGAGAPVPVPVLKTVPMLAPLTAVTGNRSASRTAGPGGASAPRTDSTTGKVPATRAGDTNVPAATQLAGLGALPGLADLPSPAGLASTPAQNGAQGGGISMPGTALSAANSGMSSDSFAALAVGALLAGASALKIASRRTRDRKAGIGVAQ